MPDKIESYLAQLETSEAIKSQFHKYGLSYAWLAMNVVTLAMLATLLTATTINVAIPQIMGEFGIGQDQAQWLSTANLAATTVGMLITSWAVLMLGTRLVVFWTMMLFLLGSLMGGFSTTMEVMILARIIQGLSTGVIIPLTISFAFLVSPPSRVGLAMGISSIVIVLAPALGPTIGGLLTESFSWRFVYFLGAPFSLLCMPLALIILPDRDTQQPKVPFDWPGLASLSAAITLIFLGLSNGVKEGWSPEAIGRYFAGALACSIIFFYWQARNPTPLLNLKVFSHIRFTIFAFSGFVFGAGLFGSTYLIPLFLQLVQNMSPTDSGLALMPAGIVMGALIPFSGHLADKHDAGVLMSWGVGFFFLSFYLMASADANTGFLTFAWWVTLGRIGICLAIPPMNMGALNAVPKELMSQASGALNFVRQLGGAFGVNLLSVVLEQRTAFHLHNINTGPAESGQHYSAMSNLTTELQTQATISAFKDSFLISALFFLVTLLPAWWIYRDSPKNGV
jgi:EmrB/QacA subfamily drug resistance transporter